MLLMVQQMWYCTNGYSVISTLNHGLLLYYMTMYRYAWQWVQDLPYMLQWTDIYKHSNTTNMYIPSLSSVVCNNNVVCLYTQKKWINNTLRNYQDNRSIYPHSRSLRNNSRTVMPRKMNFSNHAQVDYQSLCDIHSP